MSNMDETEVDIFFGKNVFKTLRTWALSYKLGSVLEFIVVNENQFVRVLLPTVTLKFIRI